MGFIATRFFDLVYYEQIRKFEKRISSNSDVCTDTCFAMCVLSESYRPEPKTTLPEKVDEMLSKVHTITNNFKTFLAGTFLGVSHRYLQEYIDKFGFRFNRRLYEALLLYR